MEEVTDAPFARNRNNVLHDFVSWRMPDMATFPRRPPRMRDDAVPFCGASDREFDEDWFAEPRASSLRLLSASAGDRWHFGFDGVPEGRCFIRLALFPWGRRRYQSESRFAAAVVFPILIEHVERLNSATDAELHFVWQYLVWKGYEPEISEPIYFDGGVH